jgi:RHS repeat-associated protein
MNMLKTRLLTAALFLATLLLGALQVRAQGYCNNPVPPCDPGDPGSGCYVPPDPPPTCEPLSCGKCTKSPCYVGSGVFVWDEQDLEVGTNGAPLRLSRHYLSTHAIDGPLGYGWTSSLATHLYYVTYLYAAPSTYRTEADIRLPNGVVYRFQQAADGSFTAPNGRYDALVRNSDGTFELSMQFSRSKVQFAADGNATRYVDDYGNGLAFTYDGNGRLQRLADDSGSGRYLDVSWGADGRISAVTDNSGRSFLYGYDASGVLVTVTDPLARVRHFTYFQGRHAPLLQNVNDPFGRNITSVSYDAQDRVHSYSDKGTFYTYTYNYNNNPGVTSKADSQGNLWQYPFASKGLVTESRPPTGASFASSHDDYYPDGTIQLHTDELGVKTYYTYSAGRLTSITYDYSTANAVRWEYTYDSTFPDRVIALTPKNPATNAVDPNWQAGRFDYWPAGSPAPGALRNVWRVEDDASTLDLVETRTYDAHGHLTSIDREGGTLDLEYDSTGNLHRAVWPAHDDAGSRPEATFTYDSLGRILSATDTLGHATTMTWDALDRILAATGPHPSSGSPVATTSTYSWDHYDAATGLLYSYLTDANGRVTKAGLDVWGRLGARIDALGQVTKLNYGLGLLGSIFDADNNYTSYGFDALHRLVAVSPPDRYSISASSEGLTYYADGRLKTSIDPKGQVITYGWDHFGRLISKTYPNGKSVQLSYTGEKLTAVVDSTGATVDSRTLGYDHSYRLITESQGANGTVRFTYDAFGRAATVAMDGGPTTTYSYYPNGMLNTVAWSPVSGVFKYRYTPLQEIASITYPNGQIRAFTYDDIGRITSVATTHPTAGLLASYDYQWDVDQANGTNTMIGQISAIVANIPSLSLVNATTKYYYDGDYRLRRADYPSGAPFSGRTDSWLYDAIGNRTSATIGGTAFPYTYLHSLDQNAGTNPLNNQQLQSDGTNTYAYDNNGNLITRTGGSALSLSWDYEDRLAGLTGAVTAAYTYDAYGRRTTKTVGGTTTSYVYSGDNLLRESTPSSTADFLFTPRLDDVLAMQRDGTVYYYTGDGANSVTLLSDAAGTVARTYVYDAWGKTEQSSGTLANPFGYTGREMGEGGLLYYRARYYDPGTGRFAAVDPINLLYISSYSKGREAQPFQVAEYAYAENSPLTHGDPLGLQCMINTPAPPSIFHPQPNPPRPVMPYIPPWGPPTDWGRLLKPPVPQLWRPDDPNHPGRDPLAPRWDPRDPWNRDPEDPCYHTPAGCIYPYEPKEPPDVHDPNDEHRVPRIMPPQVCPIVD